MTSHDLLKASLPYRDGCNWFANEIRSAAFSLQNAEDPKTWNLLYVSANAATEAMAAQTGLERRDLLGVGIERKDRYDDSAAARVALGETQLIQQTKRWLKREGINLTAFERQGMANKKHT